MKGKRVKDAVEYFRRLGWDAEHCPNSSPPVEPVPVRDFSDLTISEFERVLSKITEINELEGLSNRRRILGIPTLRQWDADQVKLLIKRRDQLKGEK